MANSEELAPTYNVRPFPTPSREQEQPLNASNDVFPLVDSILMLQSTKIPDAAHLTIRTYPGLQAFHLKLKELIHLGSISLLSHDRNKRVPWPRRYHRRLYTGSFKAISHVMEALLDSECELSADARLALRCALNLPHHFAAIILPVFYDPETFALVFDPNQHVDSDQLVDNIYAEFRQVVSRSSESYPQFSSLWDEIQNQKETFRTMASRIVDKRPWTTAVIHRVSEDKDNSLMKGKLAVFDPKNPAEFTEERYYHMYSETSYIVDSVTSDLEIHLFVFADCPWNDDELKIVLADRKGEHFIDEQWFVGLHVLNLDRIRQVREWMEAVSPGLRESVKKLKAIRRAKTREEPEQRARGSRMYATGTHIDQNGWIRTPRNFPRRMDEIAKFELMRSNDHVLDGVVSVKSMFPFCKSNI